MEAGAKDEPCSQHSSTMAALPETCLLTICSVPPTFPISLLLFCLLMMHKQPYLS